MLWLEGEVLHEAGPEVAFIEAVSPLAREATQSRAKPKVFGISSPKPGIRA
jgi:hypothetical protein